MSYCGTLDKSLHFSEVLFAGSTPCQQDCGSLRWFWVFQAIVNLKNFKVTTVSPVRARDSDVVCLL